MHDYVKTLGTVIRKAREEQGLSQASLAEKLGIDVRTIINIENFRGNPKFEVLYPLITTLRIPADRIFYPGSDAIGDASSFSGNCTTAAKARPGPSFLLSGILRNSCAASRPISCNFLIILLRYLKKHNQIFITIHIFNVLQ